VFYLELIRKLQEAKVRFLVMGNLALMLYGVPQLSENIDLLLYLEKENIRSFLKVMKNLGFTVVVPGPPSPFADAGERARWWNRKMWEVIFERGNRPPVTISGFLHAPDPFEAAYEKRKIIYALDGSLEIPLPCEADLIAIKIHSGTTQDFKDVEALQKKMRERE